MQAQQHLAWEQNVKLVQLVQATQLGRAVLPSQQMQSQVLQLPVMYVQAPMQQLLPSRQATWALLLLLLFLWPVQAVEIVLKRVGP